MKKNTVVKPKPVDLGQAQANFEQSHREWQASERALARSQEDRDRKKQAREVADEALRAAARTVLG